MENHLKKIYNFLKQDSWQSWLVSLILIIIFIKIIFFPVLGFATNSPLPLVVIESCSMYHSTNFDSWIEQNEAYYESKSISPENFSKFPFKNGLNKGDIILLTNHKFPEIGDIMVFNADARHPLIHRVISLDPIATKGDNNLAQLPIEKSISESNVLGKSSVRIPLVGWVKLIFFEPFRSPSQRGFCS